MITEKLIAHRGWQRKYPENTLMALQQAITIGAKHIEIDLQLTQDHIAILSHDQELSRLTGVTANLNKLDHTQLKTLSPHEPKRLGQQFDGISFLSLKECVDLFHQYPDVTLYVELKRASINHFGAEIFLESVLPQLKLIAQQSVLISFDFSILQMAQKLGWQKIAPVISDWQQLSEPMLAEMNPHLVFSHIDKIPGQQLPNKFPYPIAIYEIDCYSHAKQLINQGATLIETFAIGEMFASAHNDRSRH